MRFLSILVLSILLFSVYTKGQAPLIYSFSPASGPAGTVVTISGSNFYPSPDSNIVYFGEVRGTVVNASASSLSVVVPTSSTNGVLTVTTRGLIGKSNLAFRRTFTVGEFAQSSTFTETVLDSTIVSPGKANLYADFDMDGKIDFIGSEQRFDTMFLTVYRNTSSVGVFSTAPKQFLDLLPRNIIADSFLTPDNCYIHFTASDINGDGKPDIVCQSICLQKFIVLINNSTPGTISFATSLPIPKSSMDGFYAYNQIENWGSSFCIADIDADGKNDFINYFDSTGRTTIYKNTSNSGAIQFTHSSSIFFGGTGSRTVCRLNAFDLDADHLPELFTVDAALAIDWSFVIYKNTSTPGYISFSNSPIYTPPTGAELRDIDISDIDADGKPDAIIIGPEGTITYACKNLSQNPGNINFAVDTIILPFQWDRASTLTDINGDGMDDWIINQIEPLSIFDTSKTFIKINKSTPGNLVFDSTNFKFTSLPYPFLQAFDIDGDNVVDLIGRNGRNGNKLSVYKWNSNAQGPVIKSFSPTEGASATTVIIKGKNFTNTNTVTFGGIPAISFIVNSDTIVTAIVSTGNTGTISIATPKGTFITRDSFFMAVAPTIVGFTPDSATSGNAVTIKGKNFTRVHTVNIGGAPASFFSILSDTSIIANVGTGASGNVTVANPYGRDSLPGFTYLQPAAGLNGITFSPVSGPVGSLVAISPVQGGAFSPALQYIVYFGRVKAQVVSVTISSITVKVPIGADNMPVSVTTNRGLTYYSTLPFTITFDGTSISASSFDTVKIFTGIEGRGSDGSNLAAGDIDGDGRPDIVSANAGKITIFRSYGLPGTIALLPKIDIPADGNHTDIQLTDFDGDGKLDVVTAIGSNKICIIRNLSSPGIVSFSGRQYFNTGEGATELVCADFDNDGKPDIATANLSEFSVSLLRNTSFIGNISFAAQIKYVTTNNCKDVTATDLNGDRLPDIVLNKYDSIITLKNTSSAGNISFQASANPVLSGTVQEDYTYLTDADNDNKVDILIRKRAENLSIFKNSSTASNISFITQNDYLFNGSISRSLNAYDFNGDGKQDPVISEYAGIRVIENASTPGSIGFSGNSLLPTNLAFENTYNAIGCDVDMDGKPDIVSTTFSNLLVFRNKNNEGTPVKLCPPIANTSITSNISSTSYQWQVNTGTGFVNISNGANYSGASTNTLGIRNALSSWNGYKYRCLVDGNYSDISQIRFENKWTGASNSAWENPANWSCGTVPDSNTDVIINTGTIVINSNVTVRTLQINPGASLSVNTGFTLTILH